MHIWKASLREGGLSLAYNAIILVRAGLRQLTRPTEVGVRALVVRDDEVLLVRHRGGRYPWSLPGGGLGRNETMLTAIVREVREEAGCETRPRELLGLYRAINEGMINYVAVFVCEPLGQVHPPTSDLEIVDARFFRQCDLPGNTEPGSLRRVEEYQQGARGLYGPW
ncbi:MAG: NUDIX domain-containing protein [Oscillochloridaceae bacterium]|nr:NUDIX domain-containing protein [Chloroflexaceae bacterium]MDW8390930.1 NUDIX domain-containing protein [Oscillochloridaceae bacterium]